MALLPVTNYPPAGRGLFKLHGWPWISQCHSRFNALVWSVLQLRRPELQLLGGPGRLDSFPILEHFKADSSAMITVRVSLLFPETS